MRYEIVFSGSGGQGMILSGIITAEAAAVHDKKFCVQTQSYGPEARGGMTEAYVILSDDEPVDYPEITHADAVVALSQAGLERQIHHMKPDSVVIIDAKNVDASGLEKGKVFKIPFADISTEIMTRPISANIVALGALTALTQKVSASGMEKVIEKRVPKGTTEKNLAAFRAGFEAMQALL